MTISANIINKTGKDVSDILFEVAKEMKLIPTDTSEKGSPFKTYSILKTESDDYSIIKLDCLFTIELEKSRISYKINENIDQISRKWIENIADKYILSVVSYKA